jgi:hypothetical protein
MVEYHAGGVELLGRLHDLAHFAAAGVELGIGTGAAPAHDAVTRDPGALHQAHGLLYAFVVMLVCEIQANDDRRLGVGSLVRPIQQAYSGSLSAPRLMGRDGTTVEMACLYTICVTELRSNTTY